MILMLLRLCYSTHSLLEGKNDEEDVDQAGGEESRGGGVVKFEYSVFWQRCWVIIGSEKGHSIICDKYSN